MAACPSCKRENPEGTKICNYCGALMETGAIEATKALDNPDFGESIPKWGTARFNSRMNLVLTLVEGSKAFVFDAEKIEKLVIGRADAHSAEKPEIDLREFGALDKGVSRKHALITARNGSLSVVDQGSPNGTYLNGQRLVAHQPRVLRDGDDIRLGHIVLRVSFERASAPGLPAVGTTPPSTPPKAP